MQAEIGDPRLRLLAVNEKGLESGVEGMAMRGALPILQDVPSEDVWSSWAVTYRDVVVLDAQNQRIAVYNLTEHDLGMPESYRALKAFLEAALR